MRGPQRPSTPAGAYRGKVTRVDGARVHVEVLRLGRTHVYGPVDVVTHLADQAAGTGPHTHALTLLGVGDRVLVTFIEGRPDDLVVLGRLP